ncbi:MAG: DUF5675 family protein [Adhaeribacter sp.]
MIKEKPLIIVERFLYNNDCTISRCLVRQKDGSYKAIGYGMEDERRLVKKRGETCIPEGIYPLGLHQSPKFSGTYGHKMIHIQQVPGFSYCLIHPGNTDDNTEGCYLPGTSIGWLNGQAAVLTSKPIYLQLYASVVAEILKGGQFIQFKNLFPLAAL